MSEYDLEQLHPAFCIQPHRLVLTFRVKPIARAAMQFCDAIEHTNTSDMTTDSMLTEAEQPLQIDLSLVGVVSPLAKSVREKWDSAESDLGRDHSLESLLARLTAADEKRQVRVV